MKALTEHKLQYVSGGFSSPGWGAAVGGAIGGGLGSYAGPIGSTIGGLTGMAIGHWFEHPVEYIEYVEGYRTGGYTPIVY